MLAYNGPWEPVNEFYRSGELVVFFVRKRKRYVLAGDLRDFALGRRDTIACEHPVGFVLLALIARKRHGLSVNWPTVALDQNEPVYDVLPPRPRHQIPVRRSWYRATLDFLGW